jgi:hypothetical protein
MTPIGLSHLLLTTTRSPFITLSVTHHYHHQLLLTAGGGRCRSCHVLLYPPYRHERLHDSIDYPGKGIKRCDQHIEEC